MTDSAKKEDLKKDDTSGAAQAKDQPSE